MKLTNKQLSIVARKIKENIEAIHKPIIEKKMKEQRTTIDNAIKGGELYKLLAKIENSPSKISIRGVNIFDSTLYSLAGLESPYSDGYQPTTLVTSPKDLLDKVFDKYKNQSKNYISIPNNIQIEEELVMGLLDAKDLEQLIDKVSKKFINNNKR